MEVLMPDHNEEIIREAKCLSKEQRKQILMSLPETDLHIDLKSLFERMEPDYLVDFLTTIFGSIYHDREHGSQL